jgi:hypothetical protein
MNKLIKEMFYRTEDDGAGSGAGEITPDGTITTQVEQPKYVTEDALSAFADKIINGLRPAPQHQDDEEYIDPSAFESVEALSAHIQSQITKGVSQVEQRLMAQSAPIQLKAGIDSITKGMDDVEVKCFMEALNDIPAEHRAAAVHEPTMAKLLKKAAKADAIEKRGEAIPSASSVASTSTTGTKFSQADEENIQDYMKHFGSGDAKADRKSAERAVALAKGGS